VNFVLILCTEDGPYKQCKGIELCKYCAVLCSTLFIQWLTYGVHFCFLGNIIRIYTHLNRRAWSHTSSVKVLSYVNIVLCCAPHCLYNG